MLLVSGILLGALFTSFPVAAHIDDLAGGDPGLVATLVIGIAAGGPAIAAGASWSVARWGRRAYPLWLPVAVPLFVLLGFIPVGRGSAGRRVDLLNDEAGIDTGYAFAMSSAAGVGLSVLTAWFVLRFIPKRGRGRRARRPGSGVHELSMPVLVASCVAFWILGATLTAWIVSI